MCVLKFSENLISSPYCFVLEKKDLKRLTWQMVSFVAFSSNGKLIHSPGNFYNDGKLIMFNYQTYHLYAYPYLI